jgi:hypothetical protein
LPVIQFTEGDFLAGKIMEKGVYPLEITEIDGPKASASGKSVTFFTKFTVTDGPYLGKELKVAYNTGSSDAVSLLGTLQFSSHKELIKVAAAALGIPYDTVPKMFDTDTILHKQIDGIVGSEISDGNIVNTLTNYLPKGLGASVMKAPF